MWRAKTKAFIIAATSLWTKVSFGRRKKVVFGMKAAQHPAVKALLSCVFDVGIKPDGRLLLSMRNREQEKRVRKLTKKFEKIAARG